MVYMASTWKISGIPAFKKLGKDTTTDVLIVGGGLAGLWCAYLLSKAGKRVIIIEKDRLGQSVTSCTTAFITQSVDTPLKELKSIYSEDLARTVWQSHREAMDLVEKVIEEEKIDCEFMRVPLHLYAKTEAEMSSLKEEGEFARALGFDVRLVEKKLPNFMTEFQNVGVLKLPDQAKYHPMKFFRGLLKAALKNGVEVYEKTEVVNIKGKAILTIETKSGAKIKAKNVIVTTYDPFNNPKPVHLKKGMYTSYVYALRIREGLLPEGMYIDQMNPYHYFRIDRDNKRYDRLIVGGEDHRAELSKILKKKSFKALKQFVDETFPKLEYNVLEKWDCGVLEPSDGLALIGRYAPGQFLATAFSGNGMTYSPIAGCIITDGILGRKNKYASVYDPLRPFSKKALLSKARDYTGEFLGGAGKNILK
jgi:glycine/D-amino acid oxidase-like deaminating enzyme